MRFDPTPYLQFTFVLVPTAPPPPLLHYLTVCLHVLPHYRYRLRFGYAFVTAVSATAVTAVRGCVGFVTHRFTAAMPFCGYAVGSARCWSGYTRFQFYVCHLLPLLPRCHRSVWFAVDFVRLVYTRLRLFLPFTHFGWLRSVWLPTFYVGWIGLRLTVTGLLHIYRFTCGLHACRTFTYRFVTVRLRWLRVGYRCVVCCWLFDFVDLRWLRFPTLPVTFTLYTVWFPFTTGLLPAFTLRLRLHYRLPVTVPGCVRSVRFVTLPAVTVTVRCTVWITLLRTLRLRFTLRIRSLRVHSTGLRFTFCCYLPLVTAVVHYLFAHHGCRCWLRVLRSLRVPPADAVTHPFPVACGSRLPPHTRTLLPRFYLHTLFYSYIYTAHTAVRFLRLRLHLVHSVGSLHTALRSGSRIPFGSAPLRLFFVVVYVISYGYLQLPRWLLPTYAVPGLLHRSH